MNTVTITLSEHDFMMLGFALTDAIFSAIDEHIKKDFPDAGTSYTEQLIELQRLISKQVREG